jgi:ABC-type polysaccharide/polyol phosphate transport system ATPase subunit
MIDVEFANVTKRYRIRQERATPPSGVLGKLMHKLRPPATDFLALRGINLEVGRGEAFGVIGHNGAGKSTLLKLLSNITTPTTGKITISGRVAALLEIGSGFHPELTGRENVFLSGSILGMKRREIHARLDAIIDFAELRPFIDVPVKRYSSGMYVRLGFSIAAHLEPDILLLDEVLAVGDASFQNKCLERIQQLRDSGVTIIFISHDLGAVGRLCSRVALLRSGEIEMVGDAEQVITHYQNSSVRQAPRSGRADQYPRTVEITSVSFHTPDGQPSTIFRTGDPVVARVSFVAHEAMDGVQFFLGFFSPDNPGLCDFRTPGENHPHLPAGPGMIEFVCDELGFRPGLYLANILVISGPQTLDRLLQCASMQVVHGVPLGGAFHMPYRWRLISS